MADCNARRKIGQAIRFAIVDDEHGGDSDYESDNDYESDSDKKVPPNPPFAHWKMPPPATGITNTNMKRIATDPVVVIIEGNHDEFSLYGTQTSSTEEIDNKEKVKQKDAGGV